NNRGQSLRIENIRLTQGQGAADRAQALDLTGGVDVKTGKSIEGYIPAQREVLGTLEAQAAALQTRLKAAQLQAAQGASAVPGVNLVGGFIAGKEGAVAADLQKQQDTLDEQSKTVKKNISNALEQAENLRLQAK